MCIDTYDKNKPVSYRFTSCPAAGSARGYGFTDILPALCNVDHAAMEQMRAELIRTQTFGFTDSCDHTLAGGRDPILRQHPQYRDENGYIGNK